jgi:hypothetical protein
MAGEAAEDDIVAYEYGGEGVIVAKIDSDKVDIGGQISCCTASSTHKSLDMAMRLPADIVN